LHAKEDEAVQSELLQSLIGSGVVTFKGPALRVKQSPTTRLAASIRDRASPTEGTPLTDVAAILAREHGKGRVVYLPAGIDAAYYLYSYPYQRALLARAIEWAAGDHSPPIRIEAPMCVHSSIVRQSKDGHDRLIIHLFNDVNTTSFHALPTDDVPLREETIPIHDVKVTIDGRYRVKQVKQQPDDLILDTSESGSGLRVTVPRLDIHAMVVVELEP
jgi:hypothetical protein